VISESAFCLTLGDSHFAPFRLRGKAFRNCATHAIAPKTNRIAPGQAGNKFG